MSYLVKKMSFKELDLTLKRDIHADAKFKDSPDFSAIHKNILGSIKNKDKYSRVYDKENIEYELLSASKKKILGIDYYVYLFRITHYQAKDYAIKTKNNKKAKLPSRKKNDNGPSLLSHLIIQDTKESSSEKQKYLNKNDIVRQTKKYSVLLENCQWQTLAMVMDFFREYLEIPHRVDATTFEQKRANLKFTTKPSKSFKEILTREKTVNGQKKKNLIEVEIKKTKVDAAQKEFEEVQILKYRLLQPVDPLAFLKDRFKQAKDSKFDEFRFVACDTESDRKVTSSNSIGGKTFEDIINSEFASEFVIDLSADIPFDKDEIVEDVIEKVIKTYWK